MSEIVGWLGASHGPQIIMPPEKWPELPGRTAPPYHPKPGIEAEITPEAMRANSERCRAAFAGLAEQLGAWRPDALVIVGDDQHENLFDDAMPPFSVFIGEEVHATLNFKYLGADPRTQMTRHRVHQPLAREILEGLMERGFDPAWSTETRFEAGLGHAFGRPLHFIMPTPPVPIVPVTINTFYPPAPSAARCLAFGEALGAVLRASRSVGSVALLASGGLSHVKIDEGFDHRLIQALEAYEPSWLGSIPSDILVHGTSEVRNWIVTSGALARPARMLDYVPCYRNADGIGCAMGFAVCEG